LKYRGHEKQGGGDPECIFLIHDISYISGMNYTVINQMKTMKILKTKQPLKKPRKTWEITN